MKYSIIVPVYNEAQSLVMLSERIFSTFESIGEEQHFELLFVDDGSIDSSQEILRTLCQKREYVSIIFLRKNFGKSHALMAGFIHAKGEIVITMDGDLQDRPEDIPRMIRKLEQGYDLVSGWKQNRQDSKIRVWGSYLFNLVVSYLGGIRLHDFNCGFKAYRAKVVCSISVYGQYHRFIPLLCFFMGFKVAEELISHDKRQYGASKYPIFRYQGFFDLLSILFTYRYKFSPLYFFGFLGCFFIIPNALIILILVGRHILYLLDLGGGDLLHNRPLLALALTICTLGVNIFMTGFVCDFILHHQIKQNFRATVENCVDEIL